MNYYLFAILCMVGVIALLGFFSLVIYLSGMIFRFNKGKGTEKKEEPGEVVAETKGVEDSEEELRKIAAIAAVVAMVDGEQKVKEKVKERSKENERVRRKREARYPSPWMVVRE